MAQTGAIDVSPGTIRALLGSLQTQREAVQIDLAAKQARRDALAVQIARFSDEIRAKVMDDPVAAELEKVVAFKEEGIAQKKKLQQQGTIPASELNDASSPSCRRRALTKPTSSGHAEPENSRAGEAHRQGAKRPRR